MKPTIPRGILPLALAGWLAACATLPPAEPDGAARVKRGYQQVEQHQYNEALEVFDQVLQQPGIPAAVQADAHAGLGRTLYYARLQNSDKQQDSLKRLVEWHLNVAKSTGDKKLQARVHDYLGQFSADRSKDVCEQEIDRLRNQQAADEFTLSQALANEAQDAAQAYQAELGLISLHSWPVVVRQVRQRQCGMDKAVPSAQDEQTLTQNLKRLGDLARQLLEDGRLVGAERADLLLGIAELSSSDLQALRHLKKPGYKIPPALLAAGLEAAKNAQALAQATAESPGISPEEAGVWRRKQAAAEVRLAEFHAWGDNTAAAHEAAAEAARHASLAGADDLGLIAQAASGRMLLAQGHTADAVDAYRQAAFYTGQVRGDIPVFYQDGSSSYTKRLEPVYRGLADALLRQAAQTQQDEQKQKLLLEAIYAMERLKQSELEDYFKDRCALDEAQAGGELSPQAERLLIPANTPGEQAKNKSIAANLASARGNTAILYPILFDDRMEVLLISKGIIKPHTVKYSEINRKRLQGIAKAFNEELNSPSKRKYSAADQRQLEDTAKALNQELSSNPKQEYAKISREQLEAIAKMLNRELSVNPEEEKKEGRPINAYAAPSQMFYGWMLGPFGDLPAGGIDKIVYIPDGPLRLVPLAALHDGKDFAVRRYTVVTNSSLEFTSAQLAEVNQGHVLRAGVSKPSEAVLGKLPESWLARVLVEVESCQFDISGLTQEDFKNDLKLRSRVKESLARPGCGQQALNALSLDGVRQEIEAIGESMRQSPEPLLDKLPFTQDSLADRVQNSDSRYVHIASHGYFGSSADKSFIMTYDNILTSSEIEKILKPKAEQSRRIDVVTFSACETAQGDDRAPLGFSGIAIKASARNAVGALWRVEDQHTRRLMQTYYANLAAGGDAAAALQQAQKGMLNEGKSVHPVYWAAFILVGAW